MNEGEQTLVRRVLIGALTLSAVSAPATIAASPVPVGGAWIVLHTAVIATLALGLWLRWWPPTFAAAGAALMGATTTFIVAKAVAGAVASGAAPEAGLAMVTLPGAIGAGGVVFLAVRSRLAVIVGMLVLASQVVAIIWGAGAAWRTVLWADPVIIALRFGLVSVILFGLVSAIAERRSIERDEAATERARADARVAMEVERTALRERVLAEAAHELKSPLTVVRGSVELLLGSQAMDATQREAIEGALWRALDRLEERADTVLHAGTHDEPAGTATTAQPERLLEIADRARAACPPALAGRLRWQVPDVSVEVPPGDADHVLENLLSNAGKYGPSGDPIEVSATIDARHVRLVVRDCGTTLQADEVSRMFEAGFRGESTRALADGSGVGLSLVARLVHAWGGQAGCDVDVDGTRVWVTMPLSDAAHAARRPAVTGS